MEEPIIYNVSPNTPSELLNMMPSTSTQIDVYSDGVIQAVKGGELNPLTVVLHDRAYKKASERILNEIKNEILTEADKYPATFDFMGNKITKAEHGTKYDFTGCGYSDWNKYNNEIINLKEKLKECEEFLKALREPIEILNNETGEVEIVRPPVKTSTSGLNVSIR